jgi:hypothetical protein
VFIADAIDVFERLAIPIGIVLAVLVILIVPSFRKSIADSFRAGRKARERFTKGPDEK